MNKSVKHPERLANELILVSLVMVGLLLAWNATMQIKKFNENQLQLAEHSVKAAASEVGLYIKGYQRAVDIFAEENRFYLSSVELWPQNRELFTELEGKINHFFPDNLAFAIAGSDGKILIEGGEGEVIKACADDVRAFSSSPGEYLTYKHAAPDGTFEHIIIMTPWENTNAGMGVFFISFNTDRLASILHHTEVVGHHLFLVRSDDTGKVDISTPEDRKSMLVNGRFRPADMKRISNSVPVEGTRWNVVVVPDNDLFSDAHRTILVQTLLLFFGFMIINGIMRMILLDANE